MKYADKEAAFTKQDKISKEIYQSKRILSELYKLWYDQVYPCMNSLFSKFNSSFGKAFKKRDAMF